MKTPHSYRPDIDGLRALSVLAVIFFHLHESYLPGGYAGVDVFFVISGYLISVHLFEQIQNQTFSIKDFYQRRIKRILPAFYFLIVFTTIAAVLFLLPDDLKRMAKSINEAIFYRANFYFAKDYDYFAPSTAEVPLLHLWSLAVEEQFYFVFPLLLLALSKFLSRAKVLISLVVLFIGSLVLAEAQLASTTTAKMAFFSPFVRSCELLVGALIAGLNYKLPNKLWREICGVLGIIGLVVSFWFLSKLTKFPGLYSMIPCLSAAAIIISGKNNDTWVAKFLSLRVLTGIGLISYSLYLIHYPLMAITRYATSKEYFSFLSALAILIFSFLLAYLSYKFVEKPFRKKEYKNFSVTFFKQLLVPTLIAFVVANLIYKSNGFPQRYGVNQETVQQSLAYLQGKYCRDRFSEGECVFGEINKAQASRVLLLGDSHAGHFQPYFDKLGQRLGFSFVARNHFACFPLMNDNELAKELKFSHASCYEQIQWAHKEYDKFDTIILTANWLGHSKNPRYQAYLKDLEVSVAELIVKNKKVILMQQVPTCEGVLAYYRKAFSVQSLIFSLDKDKGFISASCGKDSNLANSEIKNMAQRTGAIYYHPIDAFETDMGSLPFVNNQNYYKDNDHLNDLGSQTIGEWASTRHLESKKIFTPSSYQ